MLKKKFKRIVDCYVARISFHIIFMQVLIENGHAVGVLLVRDGLQRIVRASREVVLSAGALRTPQLLLLSGIGDREHLEQHQVC